MPQVLEVDISGKLAVPARRELCPVRTTHRKPVLSPLSFLSNSPFLFQRLAHFPCSVSESSRARSCKAHLFTLCRVAKPAIRQPQATTLAVSRLSSSISLKEPSRLKADLDDSFEPALLPSTLALIGLFSRVACRLWLGSPTRTRSTSYALSRPQIARNPSASTIGGRS